MGIWRRLSLVLGLTGLALFTTAGQRASASPAHRQPYHSPAPTADVSSHRSGKRAAGPSDAAASSLSAVSAAARAPSLEEFQQRLTMAAPAQPVGLFAAPARPVGLFLEGHTALHVVGQPADDPGYVSSVAGTVTLFRLAFETGTLGFLAHSEAAGAYFDDLGPGERIHVIYRDGQTGVFVVRETLRFPAVDGSSPFSQFIVSETGERLSAAALFQRVYASGHGLVLQTCLCHNGSLTGGRLFVIAEPVP